MPKKIPELFRRRTLWWPTALGWITLLLLAGIPVMLWWFKGEDFLSRTDRKAAEVLVVEGWIGVEAMPAAKAEFERGGYDRIITSGGLSNERTWSGTIWNFPELARAELVRLGVPPEKVIAARARPTQSQRTFESAVAVRQLLQVHGNPPAAANVFTERAHARRSRLVFAKVLGPETAVGVVAWIPQAEQLKPWWSSSVRAQALIKETVGYPFELLLNSGRRSNAAN